MTAKPTGTVTFLFTDIEDSTRLAREYSERWERVRSRHHEILRESIEQNDGFVCLSTTGGLGPAGAADDGEVEDYAVTIAPPAPGSGVFGLLNVVYAAFNGPTSVFAADMDGDGDMDLLSASPQFLFFDDDLAWYENDGSQSLTPHTISTAAYGVEAVFAADVDGDGDMDVLSASAYDDTIA